MALQPQNGVKIEQMHAEEDGERKPLSFGAHFTPNELRYFIVAEQWTKRRIFSPLRTLRTHETVVVTRSRAAHAPWVTCRNVYPTRVVGSDNGVAGKCDLIRF